MSDQVFTLDVGDDGIAVITIDLPGESQNTIKAEFVDQANQLLGQLEQHADLKGVIFTSGKPGSFIAGADINMLAACKTAAEVTDLAWKGQDFCNRIANFKVPVVAAIDGVCLGGGLELALACQGRVCSDNPKTVLGLPEVQLGLLPGSGGTQRLPRLVGPMSALDMMLTGRHLRPAQARKNGLVDEIVPATVLLTAARKRLAELNDAPVQAPKKKPLTQRLLENNIFGRNTVFKQARKKLLAKTHGNYPAPERIIECVEAGLDRGMEGGLMLEARAFGELAMTPEARELMNIYFTTTAMKKDSGVDDESVQPRTVNKVGVLGAGLMGAGIAYVSTSKAEARVRLKDKDMDGLSRGLKYIGDRIDERLKRRSLTPFAAAQQRRRVTPTTDYSGFGSADVVIEAVFEDLSLKQQMVKEIEDCGREDTIFATNTSSIPITDIAQAAARPGNIIGMHYFSPVEKMPLLEIIATEKTDPEVITTAVDFGRKQGKTVIVVKDGAGFYVNRILAPYVNEAGHLLLEGVAIDTIDKALVKFGFPVGPFALLDEVGIDVGSKVGPILADAFGERMQPTEVAAKLLADGRMGKKSGKGFYNYGAKASKKKASKEVDPSVYTLLGLTPENENVMADDEIASRCVLPMLNEAARCLKEKVIRSERDGDIGAVFGIGFPPFRGGPFRYMDGLGIAEVVNKLYAYQQQHGGRYAPARILVDMASKQKAFY